MRVEYRTDSLIQDRSLVSFGEANGTTFGRIAGGFQWPVGDQPGFAAIVSEDIYEDETINTKHLRILQEFAEKDVDALLTWCEMRCMEMPTPMIELMWIGDNANEPAMRFARARSKILRHQGRKNILKVVPAPYLESPKDQRHDHYYQHFRRYLSKKALHFPEESVLMAELHVLKDEPIYSVLALSYVVSYLANYPNRGRIMD